jgi:hypothetical protein
MNKVSLSVVLSIVSLTLVSGLSATAQTRPEKWEYKSDICNIETLNKYGDEGWELVSTHVSSNNCTAFFKRPKNQIFNPPPATPPPPGPPTCSLTLSQAPVFYGIRLGMSTDELLALFPRSKEQSEIIKKLSEPYYGSVDLRFSKSTYSENKTMFSDNVSSYDISLLDNRVTAVAVQYNFSPGANRSYNWTNESWIQKLSEDYNIPKPEDWRGSDNLICQGFRIRSSASNDSAFIYIGSLPTSYDESRKRREADSEKLRRAFKP